jgi:DNA polymerase I-like protein with 3'-5' exonuclease and polymerase domains
MITTETKNHLKAKGFKTLSQYEKHVEKCEYIFWNKRFKVYDKWKDDTYVQYLKDDYTNLISGFRCRAIMNKKQVCNYKVQGPAFHVNLKTIIKVQKKIEERNLESMIMGQIHDSMILSIAEKEVDIIKEIVQEALTEVQNEWKWLIVPMSIEFEMTPKINQSWYYKEEVGMIYGKNMLQNQLI